MDDLENQSRPDDDDVESAESLDTATGVDSTLARPSVPEPRTPSAARPTLTLDRARWQKLEQLLDRALELPRSEHGDFLDSASADDPELRREIESLLEQDRRDHGVLETPVDNYVHHLWPREEGPPEPVPTLDNLGPYELEKKVGHGGMGVVYRAKDSRLGRTVALKLLPRAYSRDAEASDRLLREARAASSLDHPGICTLFDIGKTNEGQLYLVMAYYDGQTLEQKLEAGPLPVEEARRLAIQVGRGLETAHEAGILHRDIKPANIMITEKGDAKILDFGVAHMEGEERLTRTGTTVGTPAYMAPEQFDQRAADERSDIWSLGVILYQMLTGQRPFEGKASVVVFAILGREPEPVEALRPETPTDLRHVLSRALAKNPDDRYPKIGQMLADMEDRTAGPAPWVRRQRLRKGLGWLGAVLGIAAVVLLVLSWNAGGWGRGSSTGERGEAVLGTRADGEAAGVGTESPRVAVPVVGVLPFVDRSNHPDQAWIGEGLARLVADDLAHSPHLHVVTWRRLASLVDLRQSPEIEASAQDLGIEYLVTGEILPGAEGPSVAARLVETASGRQLAARRLDGLDPARILEAADDLARATRQALGAPAAESVDVFTADALVPNPSAYEDYLEGLRALTDYRHGDSEKAFLAALAKAPGFTMARYRLATVQAVLGKIDEARGHLRRAAAEASVLPPRDALYVRAAVPYLEIGRHEEAIAAYRSILEKYRFETEARFFLAVLYRRARRPAEALPVLEELARLEPENTIAWSMLGGTHLALGNYPQAVSALRRYAEMEPDQADSHKSVADAFRAQGELELAATEYARALQLDPSYAPAIFGQAVVELFQGSMETAQQRFEGVANDPRFAPRYRNDAVLRLSDLYRMQGRFRLAAQALADQEAMLAEERTRESMALGIRAVCHLELGDLEQARRLTEEAIERSTVKPTRYLFLRGLIELRAGQLESLEGTIAALRRHAEPGDEARHRAGRDQARGPEELKIEKAADFLGGMRFLAVGSPRKAISALRTASTPEGYEYTLYKLGLAHAYLASDQLPEALAVGREILAHRHLYGNRLDLEVDRIRALLLLAKVNDAMGREAEARQNAEGFLRAWSAADAGLPELEEARRLSQAGESSAD